MTTEDLMRPRSVSIAVGILYSTLVIGAIRAGSVFKASVEMPILIVIAVFVAIVALFIILYFKVGRGRNWARVTLLVLCVLTTPLGILDLLRLFPASPVPATLGLIQVGIFTVAVILVFTPGANSWFRLIKTLCPATDALSAGSEPLKLEMAVEAKMVTWLAGLLEESGIPESKASTIVENMARAEIFQTTQKNAVEQAAAKVHVPAAILEQHQLVDALIWFDKIKPHAAVSPWQSQLSVPLETAHKLIAADMNITGKSFEDYTSALENGLEEAYRLQGEALLDCLPHDVVSKITEWLKAKQAAICKEPKMLDQNGKIP